jgi:hypothetical protein
LASFAEAIAADVNRSDDRSADAASLDPASDVKLKPAEQQRSDVRNGGRRSQQAAANAERIAELERQLADRDPEKIRADLAAEQQRQQEQAAQSHLADTEQADAERYARLRDVPDRDLSDDDYRWREDRKALLSAFPKARTALEAQTRQELAAYQAQLQQSYEGAWAQITREMGQAESKPGVERGAIVKGTSFSAIADHLYEAGRKSLQPELDRALEQVRRLQGEGRQFRLSGRNGLAAARAPINGGRSAAHANGRPDMRTATSSQLFEAALRASNGDE